MFKNIHAVLTLFCDAEIQTKMFVSMISWIKENMQTNGTDYSLEYLFFNS